MSRKKLTKTFMMISNLKKSLFPNYFNVVMVEINEMNRALGHLCAHIG